jgi:hypothetical protein
MGAAMNLHENRSTGVVIPFPVVPVRAVTTTNEHAVWEKRRDMEDRLSRSGGELWQYMSKYVRDREERFQRGDFLISQIAKQAIAYLDALEELKSIS